MGFDGKLGRKLVENMGVFRFLVGGLEHEFDVSIIYGNFIIPFDFHIFQRGRYTTNQKFKWKRTGKLGAVVLLG